MFWKEFAHVSIKTAALGVKFTKDAPSGTEYDAFLYEFSYIN